MEVLLELLKSAFGAGIVAGRFGSWQGPLNRKPQKDAKAPDQAVTSCEAWGQEISQFTGALNALLVADITILYDRIKHLYPS